MNRVRMPEVVLDRYLAWRLYGCTSEKRSRSRLDMPGLSPQGDQTRRARAQAGSRGHVPLKSDLVHQAGIEIEGEACREPGLDGRLSQLHLAD
jgi:hypothetical protein